MSLRSRFRKLFRVQPRRRSVGPRVIELLEQRVLLTDVAYYDVLKGQNFSQTGTGNPVLQGGSPFRLHSSVHARSASDVTAATLGLPNSTTKTLLPQGSSPSRNFDQSFATKSALDTAFAAGNYTFTISHLMDINFSPSLDASAGANLAPGNAAFSGQVFEPTIAGSFQDTWSQSTPAVNVNGTINATTIAATLTGTTNPSATGTINATWDGSKYVGPFSFHGQNGTATIPEGFKPTLNLPADAYPNAPHITNFTAAQTVNPASDFTLTWDAFTGGTADDLITLFIFDGNNQVFHTDAIPLPSQSPRLDGTATSFKLPKNTLLANKTYQGQLWFQNFATLDTASFPGATGATGHYIATSFAIKTGTSVDTTPPDVVAYYVTKGQQFVQANAGVPLLSSDDPFFFAAFVEEREAEGSTVNQTAVMLPTNTVLTGPQDLEPDDDEGWEFFAEFGTKAALDAAFKTGKYTFAIDTVNQGQKVPAVTLPSESYPVVPHVSNWADAQLIAADGDFTLNWDVFTGGTASDFIQVSIVNESDETILETPGFWEATPLLGTARSLVIPAGTLEAGETYSATLLFANASTLDRSTYKNAIGTTAYAKLTTLSLQTIPPEGVVQFQTSEFSVNENADSQTATIVVSRTGGSEGEVTISYSTSNGTAIAGSDEDSDYTGASGILTFADGVTTQSFEVPIRDDEQSEGHETVVLHLSTPTNGAILGARATATLTIVDNELTFGPGNFVDDDGDKYTIKLSGPGQAVIALEDSNGDGKGSVKAILLSNTTSASSVTLTVTKAITGDGEVAIGRVTGAGSLSAFAAAKSDLTGSGFALAGFVGQLSLDDVRNGADISVGLELAKTSKFTLGDIATGTELRSGAPVSALTAQSFLGNVIQAPAITALTINAGALNADIVVMNVLKAVTVKAGSVSGTWSATNFGSVAITGGGFLGQVRSTGTAIQLGTTAGISSFILTGGDFEGRLIADGSVGTFRVAKNAANLGGSVRNATINASNFSTVAIGRDLVNSTILAGTKLGADGMVGGSGLDADSFGAGKIGNFSVGGLVQASIVAAGIDPQGGIFKNGNDLIVGGAASSIPAMSVAGTASADSYFAAGLFPATVKVGGISVNPKTDARFFAGGTIAALGGNVTKGPINGASVNFFTVRDDGTEGIQVGGPVVTNSSGVFSVTLNRPYNGPVLARATGGSFVDEVTGGTVNLGPNDVLTAVLPAGMTRATVTPLTTMAAARAQASVAAGVPLGPAIAAANAGVAARFGLSDILGVVPVAANDATQTVLATREQRNYGLILAGLTQLAQNLNVSVMALTAALAADLRDGTLDGQNAQGAVTLTNLSGGVVSLPATAGTTGLQAAIQTFLASSNNKTGLLDVPLPLTPGPTGLNVPGSLMFVNAPVLPAWISGQFGSFQLTATGGISLLTWNVKAGSTLPAGYALSETGVLSGTAPVLPGGTTMRITPPFTVEVHDSNGGVSELELRITIVQPPPTFTNLPPANAIVGQAYSYQVTATGGTAPHYFFNSAAAGGFRPFWLSLDLDGTLHGTPPANSVGSHTFGIAVVDLVGSTHSLATTLIVTPSPPDITIADVSKSEGNSGLTNFVFTVKLSKATTVPVSVDYKTANGTAIAGIDYNEIDPTITFTPGQTSKTITIQVRGDLDIESNETFFVNLSNPVNGTLTDNQAVGTIVNDDQLRAGQVIIRIVGNGFVTDSTGQIDTRVGRNSAIYAPNTFPFLHASSPFVEWSDSRFFTQDPPLTDNVFRNGIILTATFFDF